MEGKYIIEGAISIIIGLVLLPVTANIKYNAWHLGPNATGVQAEDTNVTNVSGLTTVLDLILYGFTFGLVALGVGMIWYGFRQA